MKKPGDSRVEEKDMQSVPDAVIPHNKIRRHQWKEHELRMLDLIVANSPGCGWQEIGEKFNSSLGFSFSHAAICAAWNKRHPKHTAAPTRLEIVPPPTEARGEEIKEPQGGLSGVLSKAAELRLIAEVECIARDTAKIRVIVERVALALSAFGEVRS